MLSPSIHLIAVGILISQLAVGYFDTNNKLLPQIPTTSSSSITINYHPPTPPTVTNTIINMARSTSTTTLPRLPNPPQPPLMQNAHPPVILFHKGRTTLMKSFKILTNPTAPVSK